MDIITPFAHKVKVYSQISKEIFSFFRSFSNFFQSKVENDKPASSSEEPRKMQKARLGQPRFLQQEKRRGKMKKRKESNLYIPPDLFPGWM